MKIAITGYTYIRKNLFEVWEHYPEKDRLFFILPKKWKAKGGSQVYYPPKNTGLKIYPTTALFWHSKYPIIRGLLKGWMPFLLFKLIYLRFKGVRLLFTASEPNILTTVHNAIVARLLGMKHVFNFWDVVPSKNKTFFKRLVYDCLVKLSIALSQGVVCGNYKATEILKSYVRLRSKVSARKHGNIKIATFPTSGLDENKFNPRVKATFKSELKLDNKFIFLYAGVFNKQKGVEYLIEAFSQIVQKIPNAYLLLIGTGPEISNFGFRISDLGIKDNVTILKWVEHQRMPELLASCDVFIYPSISHQGSEEQFGYAIAEAMLLEKPVVAFDSGAISELLKDQKNGLIVPEQDVLKLTESMLKLAESYELRQKLGQYGRRYIIDNFSHQIIADKFYQLFKIL